MLLTHLTEAHKYISGVCSIIVFQKRENNKPSEHIDLPRIVTAIRNENSDIDAKMCNRHQIMQL
jgi:hypothetical protein